jgi:hypothetical protein
MTQYGTWVSYSGTARIALAGVLFIAAAGVAVAGIRLPRPARLPRPGRIATNTMLVAWVVSIVAFLACVSDLAQQARREHLPQTRPPDPITPVTFTAVAVLFVIVILLGHAYGGYPSAPLPYTLNVVSKILAFATALGLFLRRPDSSAQAVPLSEGAQLVPLPGQVGGGRADHQAGNSFGG